MSIADRMKNAKTAATELIRSLEHPPARTGIVTFDDNTYITLNHTSDTTLILSTIAALSTKSSGGTDYVGAFLDPVTGAIDFTRTQPGERYIIFLTDGNYNMLPADEQAIITAVQAAGIRVYTLIMSMGIINMPLRRIATASGGQWFESVTTEQLARDAFRQIGDRIYDYPPCTLTYRTTGCETVRNLDLTLRKNNATVTRSLQFTVDPSAIVTLDAEPAFVDFGVVPTGQTRTMDVLLTARNGPVAVQSIGMPTPLFRVVSWGGAAPPFTLARNESRTIRIQYIAPDTLRYGGPLAIQADAPCIVQAVVAAGSPFKVPLRLVQPNGGEVLYAGSNFTIRWAGVGSSQQVTLEYSTDAGASWFLITPNAYSLAANWNVPSTPSTRCLGLVYTPELRDAGNDASWMPWQPFPIQALAFAPGGTLLAAGLSDGRIKVFSPVNGGLVDILTGHTGAANAVAFSPNAKYLVSGGGDGLLKVWDASTGTLVRDLPGHGSAVHSVVFSADGTWMASADASSVILWKTADWSQEWKRTGSSVADGALAISPKNTWVASSIGNSIAVLRLSDGARIETLAGHSSTVRTLSVSEDGALLASGGDDRTIRIWDTSNWDPRTTLSGHGASITSVQLFSSGLYLLSASRDRSVRIWDVRRSAVTQTFSGHTLDILDAKADERVALVASAGNDKTIRIWGYSPPLSDLSDSLWSIIVPSTTVTNTIPAFRTLTCPGEIDDEDIVLRNTGNQPVSIQDAYFLGSGRNAFSFAPGTSIPPPLVLQPADTARLGIRFFPNVAGDYQAILRLTTDAPNLPSIEIPLVGHKDSAGIRVGPDTTDIGEYYHCTAPIVIDLVAVNTGTVDTELDSLACTIGGSVDIDIELPRTLLAGAVDTLRVAIYPRDFGPLSGFLAFVSSPCDGTDTVFIRGSYLPSGPVPAPAVLIFGFTTIGDTSYQTVVVHNPTSEPMELESAQSEQADFAVVSPSVFPVTIPPRDSVLITLAFIPRTEGTIGSTLRIISTSPCRDSADVTLEGTSARKPAIEFSGGEFPPLLCPDERFSDSTVVVRNTGGVPLIVSGMSLGGTHAGDFAILSPTTARIDPGDSLRILIRFQPSGPGIRTATLSIANNSPLPVLIISLVGRKDSVAFTVDPILLDAGILHWCDIPLRLTSVFRNSGTVPVDIRMPAGVPADFVTYDSTRFPLRVAPLDSVVVEWEFHPTSVGVHSGTVSFTADPCLLNGSMTLSALFERSGPELPVSAYDFGTTAAPDTITRTTSIGNPSSVPMRVSAVEIDPPARFLSIREPAAFPVTVQPLGTIPLTLVYTPAERDVLAARLRVITDVPCPDTTMADITGSAHAATSTIALDDLHAMVGTRVRIPFTMTASEHLTLAGAHSFQGQVVFNRSMLWPERVLCGGGTATFTSVDEGDSAVVTIDAVFPSTPANGLLAELECLVLLGNAESSALTLRRFEWTTGKVHVTTQSGSFTVEGICREGGPRLIALTTPPRLVGNTTNRFTGSIDIVYTLPEELFTDLEVFDVLGRRVRTLVAGIMPSGLHRAALPPDALAAGSYLCVLRAGGHISTLWVRVTK
ncbi:MAG: choice-of-anchor D domain-containing protein [Bacteroidota bacterium]|nr:choice-of-anchor D domain-containing protein [Bacteroidota bacterium]